MDELQAALQKIDALTETVKALQEFATMNVGVTSAPTVSVEAPSVPTAPTTHPTTNSVPQQERFSAVRNGARPNPRRIIPITTCQNRFQILSDQNVEDDNEEVRLVGDSMVRGQLTEFCGRAPRTRKRFCIPGGGLDDVIATADEVASQAPDNTTYVIHVGTNDVEKTRSEDLLNKYRQLIRNFKERSGKLILSGIIPRLAAGRRFLNAATSVNRRLATMCREEDIGFVDTWNDFYYDKTLFSEDGIHLNQVGAARFGRLLSEAVKEFRSKNGAVHARPRQVQ